MQTSEGDRTARRACDRCKQRKAKCDYPDVSGPACSGCLSARVGCTFDTPLGKRGPKRRKRTATTQILDQPSTISPIAESVSPAAVNYSSSPSLSWQVIPTANSRPPDPNQHSLLSRWQALSEAVRPHTSVPLSATVNGYLELFFEYLYPLVPVVHEATLRSALSCFDSGPIGVQLDLDFVLLTSVCAEAAFFTPHSFLPEGRVTGPLFLEASLSCLAACAEQDLENPSSRSVIVRYFHSNCLHASAKPKLSWHCFGEAIRIAQALNLQDEASYESLPVVEAELRRRAFWLVCLGDKSAATLNDKPIAIHKYSFESGITAAYPSGHLDDVIIGFNACVRLWNCSAEILLEIRLIRDKRYHQDQNSTWLTLEEKARLNFLLVQLATCLDDLPPTLLPDQLRHHEDRDKKAIIQATNLQVTQTCLRLVMTQKLEELNYWAEDIGLLALRKSEICRDMLRVIQEAPFWALQVNGEPCVEKIRLVGASMLSLIDLDRNSPLASRARRDFMILLDILTRLDSKASDALRAGSSWDF